MANINFATREVNCKIVFYGPGRSGKTTNLEIIHEKAPKDSISGELVSIATETDRTLFFDFLPLDLGSVAGMNTKFQLYTVPGQVYYNATRKLVLQGADGVVFVADSQKSMREENVESLNNLIENLAENGLRIEDLALVLQWNKRDLEDIDDPEYLNEYLNQWGCPAFEAIAIKGDGVFPTLKSIASQVIKKLNQETGFSEGGSAPVPAAKAPPPAAAPAAAVTPPPPAAA
ncbi:MAG: GTP-binding protein, partial [Planctomycetota bacterium]